ncbi:MAG: hypothetical protein JEZ06_13825 [Anaerolineaceae bacterium]|nr:hypothetical protein [Anaerolineaceae bacterium]
MSLNDQVISVDGLPPELGFSYPGKRIGDSVDFILKRGADTFKVTLVLSKTPNSLIIENLVPIPIAFAFWALGVITIFFRPFDRLSIIFLLYTQMICTILCFGVLSGLGGPLITNWVYRSFVWWIGPVAILLHVVFPGNIETPFIKKLINASFSGAFVFNIVHVFMRANITVTNILRQLAYIWLFIHLLGVIILLIYHYRKPISSEARRKTGILVLGVSLGLSWFIILALLSRIALPGILFLRHYAFFGLLLLPISYGLAIFRHKMVYFEKTINRSAAYFLSFLLLLVLYFSMNILFYYLIPTELSVFSIPAIGITLVLVLITTPFYRKLQKFVDKVLYGGWYDYRSAVKGVVDSIEDTKVSPKSQAEAICDAFSNSMKLENVGLILWDGTVVEKRYGEQAKVNYGKFSQIHFDSICDFLSEKDAYYQVNSQELIKHNMFSDIEKEILVNHQSRFWIPLRGYKQPVGILSVGKKIGGEVVEHDDMEIFEVVAQQARFSLENALYLSQNQMLHQKALEAREEERKRVAHDLHDQIIQSLIGLRFHVAELEKKLDENQKLVPLQTELMEILNNVRQICSDLRPPALDQFGLEAAFQTKIADFKSKCQLDVIFQFKGYEPENPPEDIALCIFRVLQEALVNIEKHSNATSVMIIFEILPEKMSLDVIDNGKGFNLPKHMNQLAREHHFGLVGIQEQLAMLGGSLELVTEHGGGFHLKASIPINFPQNKK